MKSLYLCVFLSLSLLTACAVSGDPPPMAAPATATPLREYLPEPTPDPPTPTPAATPPPCTEQSGETTRFAVEAAGLAGPLQARVHLPPCYAASGETRYPVLYLLHGQGFDAGQWERLGAAEVLDRLTAAGEVQPMLLVLPEEPDTNANPFESPFGPALIDGLIPAIDAAYPTCPLRGCRAIGGLSRGASWALYLALSHPGLFSIAGAHSLPPFHGLEERLPDLLAAIPPGQMPHIVIDIGVSDRYRAPAAEFETHLNQNGIPHEWYLNQGGHDEAYWSAHVEEYLRAYDRWLSPTAP